MTCVLCHNGTLVPVTADKVLSQAGVTLVIHFDEAVTRRLLAIAREAAAGGIVVDVRRYVAA